MDVTLGRCPLAHILYKIQQPHRTSVAIILLYITNYNGPLLWEIDYVQAIGLTFATPVLIPECPITDLNKHWPFCAYIA